MPRERTHSRRLWLRCVLASCLGLACALLPSSLRSLTSLTLLAHWTGQHQLDPLAKWLLVPITETDGQLMVAGQSFRIRRYAPRNKPPNTPGVVLLHGVHPRGIDEPRLQDFARTLAMGGLDVLTPELPELIGYRLESSTIEHLRQLAQAHAAETNTASVGLIGISFAGGLALMAASEQAAARPIGFVVAVGAHDDLMRLCRYYAGEDVRGPAGERVLVAPHPYGARVMIREHLERFFSSADLPVAQQALDSYLHDRPQQAHQLAERLSTGGQRTMTVLLDNQQRAELAQLLTRAAELAKPQLMAASPDGHLAGIRVPIFLVHGESDPVIPSIETRYLAAQVPPRWLREALITPLLRHAELSEQPSLSQTWQLVRFLKGIYQAAGSTLGRAPTTSL